MTINPKLICDYIAWKAAKNVYKDPDDSIRWHLGFRNTHVDAEEGLLYRSYMSYTLIAYGKYTINNEITRLAFRYNYIDLCNSKNKLIICPATNDYNVILDTILHKAKYSPIYCFSIDNELLPKNASIEQILVEMDLVNWH